jgi:hypothetical protein
MAVPSLDVTHKGSSAGNLYQQGLMSSGLHPGYETHTLEVRVLPGTIRLAEQVDADVLLVDRTRLRVLVTGLRHRSQTDNARTYAVELVK